MECCGWRILTKIKTMTSKEILQTGFLEILFQNRNKAYGAYALRKEYNVRLAKALSITVSISFFLFLVLMQHSESKLIVPVLPKDSLVLTNVHLPKPEQPELPKFQPKQTVQRATIKNTVIDIVANDFKTEVPTIEQIETGGQIAAATQTGVVSDLPPQKEETQNTGTKTVVEKEETKPVGITSAPQFPGGQQAWLQFLTKHLRSPEDLQSGERKRVLVKFIVNEDGTITQFNVVQSGGAAFDAEVIRVLKKMPCWKPALQNGVAVTTTFSQPVTFETIEE